KVDAEIPSPVAGVLAEVVVQEGQTLEVGTVVAYIETAAGAAVAAGGAPRGGLPGAAVRPADVPAPRAGAPVGEPGARSPRQEGRSAERDAAAKGGEESLEERLRTRSSPLVRRIAAEHGVQGGEVPGSGRMGRVTKEDILSYVEERKH